MDVDVPLRVFADAVSVAVFDVGGRLAPVVDGFVLMVGVADDGKLAAGLVSCAEDERGGGCQPGSGKKVSTCNAHVVLRRGR